MPDPPCGNNKSIIAQNLIIIYNFLLAKKNTKIVSRKDKDKSKEDKLQQSTID